MLISLGSDEITGIAGMIAGELERRGHSVRLRGAFADGERSDWAWAAEAVARDVAGGIAEHGVVCCWTGTGASIAANKVAGVRAALCGDAATAAGARRWNDANVLALSLRATSAAELGEILDAWFDAEPSVEAGDRANVAHLGVVERGPQAGVSAQLSVRDGLAAVEFYKRAFGAVEVYRVGGSEANPALVSQLSVGHTSFWVADESPAHANFSPETLGGGTTRLLLLLVVADPEAAVARALAAGAGEVRAVSSEHGWRLGRIEDPFGHHWEIGAPLVTWPPRGG